MSDEINHVRYWPFVMYDWEIRYASKYFPKLPAWFELWLRLRAMVARASK